MYVIKVKKKYDMIFLKTLPNDWQDVSCFAPAAEMHLGECEKGRLDATLALLCRCNPKGQDVDVVWQQHLRLCSRVGLSVCDRQAADFSTRLLWHISGDNEAEGSSPSTGGWSDCDQLPHHPAVKPASWVVWLNQNSFFMKLFTTNILWIGLSYNMTQPNQHDDTQYRAWRLQNNKKIKKIKVCDDKERFPLNVLGKLD